MYKKGVIFIKKEIDMEKSDGYFIISLDGNIIKKNIKDFPANHPMLLAVIEAKVPPMKIINIVENNLEFVLINKEINLVYKNNNEEIDQNFRQYANCFCENKLYNSSIKENALNFFNYYNKREKYINGTPSNNIFNFAKKPITNMHSFTLFEKYANYLKKCVNEKIDIDKDGLVLCCVPSCNECNEIKNNMALVIRYILNRVDKKIYDGSNVLYRKYEVPKSSISHEKRSYSRQYDSLGVRNKELIKDKNVLLIDDIYSSGASMHACKEKLLENGAKKVYLFAYARTRSDFYG